MRKTYKYRLYPTTAKQHAPWSRLTAAVEDLNVKGLARGMLAKSVTDAGLDGRFSSTSSRTRRQGLGVCWCKSTLVARVKHVSVAHLCRNI